MPINEALLASQAQITVTFNQQTTQVTVEDNGNGFVLPQTITDPSRLGNLGSTEMQQTAWLLGGSLRVESGIDKGTMVIVQGPLPL
jgi:two-component system sensor histidine kinase DegS